MGRKLGRKWGEKLGENEGKILKAISENKFVTIAELAKICYKKLLFLLFEDSYDYNHFGYEDLLGRSKLDFEKIISNYFSCLTTLCSIDELLIEYIEYIIAKRDYDFESTHNTIFQNLSREDLQTFEELVSRETQQLKKQDYEKYDLIYLLLDLAIFQNDNEKYKLYCETFHDFLEEDEFDYQ